MGLWYENDASFGRVVEVPKSGQRRRSGTASVPKAGCEGKEAKCLSIQKVTISSWHSLECLYECLDTIL